MYDDGRVHIKEGNKIERNAFHGVAVRDGGVYVCVCIHALSM